MPSADNSIADEIKSYLNEKRVATILDDAVNIVAVQRSSNCFGLIVANLTQYEHGPLLTRINIEKLSDDLDSSANFTFRQYLCFYGKFRGSDSEVLLDKCLLQDGVDSSCQELLKAISVKFPTIISVSTMDNELESSPIVPANLMTKLIFSMLYQRICQRVHDPFQSHNQQHQIRIKIVAVRASSQCDFSDLSVTVKPKQVTAANLQSLNTFYDTLMTISNSKIGNYVVNRPPSSSGTSAPPAKGGKGKKDLKAAVEVSLEETPFGILKIPEQCKVEESIVRGWINDAITKAKCSNIVALDDPQGTVSLKLHANATVSDLAKSIKSGGGSVDVDISEAGMTIDSGLIYSTLQRSYGVSSVKIGFPSKVISMKRYLLNGYITE